MEIRFRPTCVMLTALAVFGAVAIESATTSVGTAAAWQEPQVASEQSRTVWSGVYTEEQSTRGGEIYAKTCAGCHAATLGGIGDAPSLAGEAFMIRWKGANAGELFTVIHTMMPQDSPGELTPEQAADVLAFIFNKNNFPVGQQALASDETSLKTILIEPSADAAAAPPPPQLPARSVWDGVYTAEQSTRGEGTYTEACANCHKPALEGGAVVPALAGADFMARWGGSTAGDLFERIRGAMPPDNPGGLTPEQYADLVAFIFSKNKFPAGQQVLASDFAALTAIKIESSKSAGE